MKKKIVHWLSIGTRNEMKFFILREHVATKKVSPGVTYIYIYIQCEICHILNYNIEF